MADTSRFSNRAATMGECVIGYGGAQIAQDLTRFACQIENAPLDDIGTDLQHQIKRSFHGVKQRKRDRAAFVLLGARDQFGNAVVQVVDVAPVAMAAPADYVGLKALAQLRRDVEKSRAIGRKQPLVSMHRQHIRLDAGGIEAQSADALGSVEEQQDAARVQKLRHFG